jgi:general stress protein 26
MNKQELLSIVHTILDEVKTGILATCDKDGTPHVRWVSPGCPKERAGAVYIISSEEMTKVEHIRQNPTVELMLQTVSLDKIVTLRGKMNVLENPSIRSETLECIGPRLNVFWKMKDGNSDLVVLELVIEEGSYYQPMRGIRETVRFD